ncbi:tetratricopeptide repeat-containing glycosyltransferase family 2 protein [Clostridium sp. ZS2-4]|uniref:tetratricopeptide repeat-containing glycosyltransferase family 2 protein n=1 Tax=Clostridium sp. ZS2-4 TaxID=2987703 RepID=UPI00227C1DE7|nr:TPR domain-containing glycosyltransferase [Clostridium sp. ZS2-4]MCY6353847.1 glycosyltransferase [Clostridium sp. ZS2-4]
MVNEISLCMIVKNEEENLPRCLESVKDLVDEIIVVDTGSTDKTVEIAKSYGAKVYYFQWCNDFSAARNESLKYATKDWILIMDADDEFCREDKCKFKELIKNLELGIVYYFETLSYLGYEKSSNINVNINPRLFKNNYGYHYEGEVHNQLVNSNISMKGKIEPIRIYHYGYLTKNMIAQNKRKRNISSIKEQIKKEPQNKYHHFNLGNEYNCLNEKEKALECYYKAYDEFKPYLGYSPKLLERIIVTNYNLKYFEKALEFINIGLDYYPDFTDLYYLRGIIYNEQNKSLLAIKAFEKCIELGEAPVLLKSIYGTEGFRSLDELSRIYIRLKDYDTAYKYCIETIKSKPDYLAPLYSIAHILKEKNTPIDEFKNKIEGFFSDFPREYSFIADLFYNVGHYETALKYIEKLEAKIELPQELMFFKAKCLIRTAKFDECIKIDTIPRNSLLYVQLFMYKVICFIMTNKYDSASIKIDSFNDSNLFDYDKKMVQVYKQLVNLFINKATSILADDENEKDYTSTIFEICEIFLIDKKFDEFEKALDLLNLISDKSVLLQLGKLYYKYGYIDMAKKEIIRSIKLFEVMDAEGLDILKTNL